MRPTITVGIRTGKERTITLRVVEPITVPPFTRETTVSFSDVGDAESVASDILAAIKRVRGSKP